MITKASRLNFIVPRPAIGVPSAGDRLYNATTGIPNLAVGGFGIYRPYSYNTYNTTQSGNLEAVGSATAPFPTGATPVVVASAMNYNTPWIQLFMRRDMSADKSPLYTRQWEKSAIIRPDCRISYKGQAWAYGVNNLWQIGAASGAGMVNILDTTEYTFQATARGRRVDMLNGINLPTQYARFTTPEYSTDAIYTTSTQQRDHLLQNLAANFNNVNYADGIAICVDVAGTGSAQTGATALDGSTVAALAIGSTIVIGYTNNAQAIYLTISEGVKQALIALDTATANTAYIYPYALNTSANTAASLLVAGGTAAGTATSAVTIIAILALNDNQAYFDEMMSLKKRLNVGLTAGFTPSVTLDETVNALEPRGAGTTLKQWYSDMMANRINIRAGHAWQGYSVPFPTEILTNEVYDIYVIEHGTCGMDSVTNAGTVSYNPYTTVVALVNTERDSGTSPYSTGSVNPQQTYFEAVMNAFVGTASMTGNVLNHGFTL